MAADAPGEPHLHDADSGHDPADVARRQPAIDEAMQLVRIVDLHAGVLVFHSKQELRVLAEAEGFGDAGIRSIGAHEVACRSGGAQIEAVRRRAAWANDV